MTGKAKPMIVSPFSVKLKRDWDLEFSNKNYKDTLLKLCKAYQVLNKVERLKQEPYPKTCLLAKFAQLTYKNFDEIEKQLPEDWFLVTTATNINSSNKYFGAVFFNPKLLHVVIAHRGTNLKKLWASFITDIIGIYLNKYVDQIDSATTFADYINTCLHEISTELDTSFQLSFTGHSLGGWLSQITTFTVKYLKMDSQFFYKHVDPCINCHAHCEVFDTPGCEEMLNKIKRTYDLRYYNPLLLDQLDITCFLSAPNLVNICNHHVGKVYRLKLEFKDKSFYSISYDYVSHSIEFLLSVFIDKEDLCSDIVCEVFNWPSGFKEYKAFFNYGNKSNNYDHDFRESLIQNDLGISYNRVYYHTTEYKENVCSLRVFTEEELQFLGLWDCLVQKRIKFDEIQEFFVNQLQYHDGMLGEFNLDTRNRVLSCSSRKELQKTIRNCKQLMRWFHEEIIALLKKQNAAVPFSVETLLLAATTNYTMTLKENKLKFIDNIGFKSFLTSDKHFVNIILHSNNVEIERLRFYNVFEQIRESSHQDALIKRFIQVNGYVFLTWKHLVYLNRFVDIDYVFKSVCEVNLIVVDFLYNLILFNDNEKQLLHHLLNIINDPSNNKKVIFLTSDTYDKDFITEPLVEILNNKCIESIKVKNIAYSDLDENSQLIVLDNIKVRLQNDFKSLRNILFVESVDVAELNSLSNLITSKTLISFITKGLGLEICNTQPSLCNAEVSQTRFYKEYTYNEFKELVSLKEADLLFFITSTKLECDFLDKIMLDVVSVSNEDEALNKYVKYCCYNQDKQVFWFHVDTKSVVLKQHYNANFYIQRRFNHRVIFRHLLEPAKKEENPDLFIFSDVIDVNKQSFINKLAKRIFLVEENIIFAKSETDAEAIFQEKALGTRSVHWFKVIIENDTEEYVWYRSKGSLENLRTKMVLEKGFFLEELDLCKNNYKTVIISDGPGAGKSTTLINLMNRLSNAWVIKINLKDCDYFSDMKEPITIDEVVELLLSKADINDSDSFSRYLLKYLLKMKKSNIPVYLLFDGFDEIRGNTKTSRIRIENYIIQLLKFLKSETNANVWVTTRDNKEDKLEDSLSVFAIKFNQIEEIMLKEFLKMFWKSRQYMDFEKLDNKSKSIVERQRKMYIDTLFENAKQLFGNKIDSFISVPLQIRMLAEVAEPNLESLKQSDEFTIEIPTNIRDLFQKFFEAKCEIYFQQKTRLCIALNSVTKLWLTQKLSEKHRELAWFKVFNTGKIFIQCSFEEYVELNTAGLIQVNSYNSDFDFIDQTVADYFAAERLMEILKGNNKRLFYDFDVKNLMLKSVLLLPDYRVIRQLLDCHLYSCSYSEMECYTREIIQALTKKDSASIYCDTYRRTLFHILILEKCIYVLQFLLDSLLEEREKNNIKTFISIHEIRDKDNHTAFYKALKYNFKAGIKEYLNMLINSDDKDREKLLLATLFRGKTDLNSAEFKILLENVEKFNEYKPLVELCNEIKEKFVYINKFQEAVKKGDLDEVKLCLKNVGNDIYRKYLLLTSDHEMNTALILAVQNNQEEVVNHLLKIGADVKTQNKYGMTTVAWAAKVGNLDMVKMFIDRGCSYEKPDRNRINPMQHAAKNGHIKSLTYFIDTLKVDIHYKDRFGNTALAWATRGGYLNVVKFLLDRKAFIECQNGHGMRPLHMAIKAQNWAVFKELIKRGADITVADGYGISPINRTIATGKLDMINFLQAQLDNL